MLTTEATGRYVPDEDVMDLPSMQRCPHCNAKGQIEVLGLTLAKYPCEAKWRFTSDSFATLLSLKCPSRVVLPPLTCALERC